ncbi:hypothetical protein [Pleionea sp. CnH1-48]|uniref:hypothetical protein n=1 Tax=Pleionea sp. CnH1-48 TaxID=2954494 RepID=UPI002096B2CE|nr:hypothetical protein [Pleionea sp. CnH1-48]MCO7226071.1 hypothetical protein [Pleionea sp. CnH1-48]
MRSIVLVLLLVLLVFSSDAKSNKCEEELLGTYKEFDQLLRKDSILSIRYLSNYLLLSNKSFSIEELMSRFIEHNKDILNYIEYSAECSSLNDKQPRLKLKFKIKDKNERFKRLEVQFSYEDGSYRILTLAKDLESSYFDKNVNYKKVD